MAFCRSELAIRFSAILQRTVRTPLCKPYRGPNAARRSLRLTHAKGEIYSLNLLSLGFTADVGALTNRYFKPFGYFGYLLGVFVRVLQLRRRAFRLRCDDDTDWNDSRCLFLSFSNSKFTGGTMLIAPQDVWKLAMCLKARRKDLRLTTIRTGPTGLCLISRLDPHSDVLVRSFDELVAEYVALDFRDYEDRSHQMPDTVENTFAAVRSCIASLLQDS